MDMYLYIFEISTSVHVSKGTSRMRRFSSHSVSVVKLHTRGLSPLAGIHHVNFEQQACPEEVLHVYGGRLNASYEMWTLGGTCKAKYYIVMDDNARTA